MGRPVVRSGALKTSSATLSPLVDIYPSANVQWHATTITAYKYQWITDFFGGAGFTARMQVNGSDVVECHLARSNLEPTCLVVPLGGISFTAGERVGWVISTSAAIWAAASFVGATT